MRLLFGSEGGAQRALQTLQKLRGEASLPQLRVREWQKRSILFFGLAELVLAAVKTEQHLHQLHHGKAPASQRFVFELVLLQRQHHRLPLLQLTVCSTAAVLLHQGLSGLPVLRCLPVALHAGAEQNSPLNQQHREVQEALSDWQDLGWKLQKPRN